MGCDIHAYIEVKVDGKWHLYSQPRFPRSYKMFAKLAGVRNREDIDPISEPRGLPENLSSLVNIEYEHDELDAHSESYLNREELELFTNWVNDPKNGLSKYNGDFEHSVMGYANGNPYYSIGKYPESHAYQYKDVRMVFWFDN